MADELQNANIQITSAEDTGQQIKIRDQNKRTYSFFKTKKDGGETAAFKNYQHFKIGDTVEISYKEVPYKEGTIKNVLVMKPATGPAEKSASMQGEKLFKMRGPGREYWEEREQKRQSSILMQVAFKAAIAIHAAKIETGEAENREKMYADALEFYDWMADQIGETGGIAHENAGTQKQREQLEKTTEYLDDFNF